MKRFYKAIWLVMALINAVQGGEEDSLWRHLDVGLELGIFPASQKSRVGDSRVTVLRIDPRHYEFKLLTSTEYGREPQTVRRWAEDFGLIAAVNAGMYQEDHRTSVGFLQNFDHVNNPHVNKNRTIFAFNPTDSTFPPAQIIDRTCQDFEALRPKYRSFLQSIRMLSCRQENVWSPRQKAWSIVALGMDKQGRILFLFTQSPYTVHDFINILLELPLDIYNAMYLEGGPPATLYISCNGFRMERHGIIEAGPLQDSVLNTDWPIPNVLGVVKKREE